MADAWDEQHRMEMSPGYGDAKDMDVDHDWHRRAGRPDKAGAELFDGSVEQEGVWVPLTNLLCPLTGRLLRDPYMTRSGSSYEGTEIKKLIAETGTSPLTHQKNEVSDLVPNKVLARVVAEASVMRKRSREENDTEVEQISASSADGAFTPPRKVRPLYQRDSTDKELDPQRCAAFNVRILFASPLILRNSSAGCTLSPLNLQGELQSLHDVVGPRCEVRLATAESLREALVACPRPKILHISAHGTHCGKFLLLENADGSAFVMGRDEFAAAGPWNTVSLLIILACNAEGLVHRLRISKCCPEHVVYCTASVHESAAQTYLREFYRALSAQHALSVCHDIARQAVRSSTEPGQAESFVLISDGATGSRHRPMSLLLASNVVLEPQQPSIEDYRGHNKVMSDIGSHFRKRRALALVGARGLGKTALSKAFCSFFSALPGRFFAAGAFVVDAAHLCAMRGSEASVLEQAVLAWILKRSSGAAAQLTGLKREDLYTAMRHMDQQGPWLLVIDGISSSTFHEAQLASMHAFLADLLSNSLKLHLLLTTDSLPPASWATAYSQAGVKLVDLELPPLDRVDAARLFLRRIRRPLYPYDFQAASALRNALPEQDQRDQQGALTLLLHSRLMTLMGGVPGRILAAAAEVTHQLPTLMQHPWLKEMAGAGGHRVS